MKRITLPYQKNRILNKYKNVQTSNKTSNIDYLGVTLKFFAIVGIILSFFGYFVAAGISDSVGINFGVLISSPTDLFYFSTLGFLSLVSNTEWDVGAIFFQFMEYNILYLLLFGLIIFCVVNTNKSDQAINKRKAALDNFIANNFKSKILLRLIFSFAAYPIAILLGFLICTIFFAFILIPMILGISAGKNYVRATVFEPTSCTSHVKYDTSKKINQAITNSANCIRIFWHTSQGIMSEKGRFVVGNSSYVIIYNPSDGQSKRIQLSGQTIIEQIVTLN